MFFKQGAMIERSQSTATSGGTLTLTNTSQTVQILTGSQAHTVQLPNATTMVNGQRFDVVNSGTGTITVQDYGSNVLSTVAAGKTRTFRLTDNSTSNGTFDVSAASASGSGVTATDQAQIQAGQAAANSKQSAVLKLNPEQLGANVFVTKAANLTARYSPLNFSLNGFGYIGGGNTGSESSNVERYDDTNNFWITKSNLDIARSEKPASFVLNGFGYAAGGTVAGNTATATSTQYNDSTDTWTAKASLSQAKFRMTGWANNSLGYALGGGNGSSLYSLIESYVDSSNTWITRSNMTLTRDAHESVELNGILYTNTGVIATTPTWTQNVEKYNPTLNASSSTGVNSVQSGRSYPYGFASNGLAYFCGGSISGIQSYSEEFNDSALFMRARANMANARAAHGNFAINQTGFVASGLNSSSVQFASTELYRNFAWISVPIVKNSALTPTAINVLAKINGLTPQLPLRVRTAGNEWKNGIANSIGSLAKLGETITSKFQNSGYAYAAGGDNTSVAINSVEAYNSGSNTWIVRQSTPVNIELSFTSSYNGLGYMIGGSQPSLGSNGYSYNDTTNAWSSGVVGLTQARNRGAGCALNGFIYNVGGAQGSGNLNDQFNPTTNTATSKTAMSAYHDTIGIAYALAGGVLAPSGNTATQYVSTTTVELYSDATNSWTNKAAVNTSLTWTGGFALNGYGYLPGGINGSTSVQNLNQRYDVQANSWTNMATLTTARFGHMGCFYNGFGYVASGAINSTPTLTSSAEAYNDASNAWTSAFSLNTARWFATSSFTPGSYRKYEIQVGVPAIYQGVGSRVFVARSNMVNTHEHIGCGTLNGNAMQFFGQGYASPAAGTESFNADTNVWSLSASGVAQLYLGSFTLQDAVYAVNGVTSYPTAVSSLYMLQDPLVGWVSKTGRPNATNEFGAWNCNSINGFGYAMAGYNNGTTLSANDQYNPVTNSWTSKAAVISGSSQQRPMSFPLQGLLYLATGRSSNTSTYVNYNAYYNDAANTWTSTTVYPNGIAHTMSKVMDGRGLAVGGILTGGSTVVASSYALDPSSQVWIAQPSFPVNLQQGGAAGPTGIDVFFGGDSGGAALSTSYQSVSSLKNVVAGITLEVTES